MPAYEASYGLEYGTNTLCMHKDALTPSDSVLIVDDVLATGGTIAAMRELVAQCQAKAVGVAVLLEMDALNGRTKCAPLPVVSLLHA